MKLSKPSIEYCSRESSMNFWSTNTRRERLSEVEENIQPITMTFGSKFPEYTKNWPVATLLFLSTLNESKSRHADICVLLQNFTRRDQEQILHFHNYSWSEWLHETLLNRSCRIVNHIVLCGPLQRRKMGKWLKARSEGSMELHQFFFSFLLTAFLRKTKPLSSKWSSRLLKHLPFLSWWSW